MKKGDNTSTKQANKAMTGKNVIHLPSSVSENSPASFGSVIKKYRMLSGMSQMDLAEVMQTSRNTILNWETEKAKPSTDAIKTLCNLLGIPLYELFGIPNQEMPNNKERILLRTYRQLSDVSQKTIDKIIACMLEEEINARDTYLRNSYLILPYEGTAAAAGSGCSFNDLPPTPMFLKKNKYSEEADTVIRVSGKSMEPLYHNGDLLYVIFTQDYSDNDDVICSTADGAVVKRVRNNKLYSLNDQYPYGEKNDDDNVKVLGRVIGIVGKDDIASAEDQENLEQLLSKELREFNQTYHND